MFVFYLLFWVTDKLLAVVWNEVVKHDWTNYCVAHVIRACLLCFRVQYHASSDCVLLNMSSRERVKSPVSTASNDVTGISRWLRIAVRIRSSTGLRRESVDVLAGMSINPRYLGTINIYLVNMVEDSVNKRHGERRVEHNTELCFGCQSTTGFWMRWKRLRMNLWRYR